MSNVNHLTLGETTTEGGVYSDAVHIAVVKAYAMYDLNAGDPVYLAGENAYGCNEADAFGIVDPFAGKVKSGSYFLVLVKPGTTRNLRHVWDHDDLPSVYKQGVEEESEPYNDECRFC